MKWVHNVLMAYQWSLMVGGALAAPVLGYYFGVSEVLLSLGVSLLALAALKLEVLAFAR